MNDCYLILTDLNAPEQEPRVEWRLPRLEKRLMSARHLGSVGRLGDYLAAVACPHQGISAHFASLMDPSLEAPLCANPPSPSKSVGGVYLLSLLVLNVGLNSISVEGVRSLHHARAARLTDLMNRHFSAEGLRFIPCDEWWVVKSTNRYDWLSAPVEQLIGRDMREAAIAGKDGALLKKIMTEIQMLCHQDQQSYASQAQGEDLAIGQETWGVWLWGHGEHAMPKWPRALEMFGEDALLRRWVTLNETMHPAELAGKDRWVLLPTLLPDEWGHEHWAERLDLRVEQALGQALEHGAKRVYVYLAGQAFCMTPGFSLTFWRSAMRVRAWWEWL